MRAEIGHYTIETDDQIYEFLPSFKNIRKICSPAELPAFYARLFGADVQASINKEAAINQVRNCAALVLMSCCDDDVFDLVGRIDYSSGASEWVDGLIPPNELVIVAQGLLNHGLVGVARDGDKSSRGESSDTIDVYTYVNLAIAHLGMSKETAENLTKTEFDAIVDAKYPDNKKGAAPTVKQHEKAMDWLDQVNAKREAAKVAKNGK